MQSPSDSPGRMLKSYVVGLVLALVLTAVPFALVATRALEPAPTLAVIAVLGVVQIAVHLRYFLHLDLTPSSHPELLVLAFAAILIFIMIGGSLWIMFDLQDRMMRP
jgi:cytochrome o ubiquinol oxidase subunit IV